MKNELPGVMRKTKTDSSFPGVAGSTILIMFISLSIGIPICSITSSIGIAIGYRLFMLISGM